MEDADMDKLLAIEGEDFRGETTKEDTTIRHDEDGITIGGNVSTQDEEVLGKEFNSLEEAYNFYNHYAFNHGFGIRKHDTIKNKRTEKIYSRKFVCDKQGFKVLYDKRYNGKEPKRRRDTRTGCKAMIQVSVIRDGKWIIDKFDNVHNHDLITSPSKAIKHRSHSKFHLFTPCKSLVSRLRMSGLRPSLISRIMNDMLNVANLSALTSNKCSRIISEEEKKNIGKQCVAIVQHFQELATSDPTHYFAMDLAEDGTVRNVFWADGRSIESYAIFGDVLVFDVTYKTNKFLVPFSSFIGVNHHRQSIIFGGALLADETEETFVWLFKQFLKCMSSRSPVSVITDQDIAIGNAVKKVFPNARHRFSVWHLKKHVIEHIKPLCARYDDFRETYNNWIKSQTIEEFDNNWKSFSDKYNIEEGSWLAKMFTLRKHWANPYLSDTFFAGMTTSGRSESIHSFFDGYVNSNTMLDEFVLQYEKALESRRRAEEDEDFRTMNSRAVLISSHPIEVKAGECYTRCMFEIFKEEWKASFECFHYVLSKTERNTKYSVGLINSERKTWKIVEYSSFDGINFSCSCAKLVTDGMLCKHILYIMRKKLTVLPDHFILPRWTIKSRYKVGNGGVSLISQGVLTPLAWSIQAKCIEAIENARDYPSDLKKIDDWFGLLLEEQAMRKKVNGNSSVEAASQVCSFQDHNVVVFGNSK